MALATLAPDREGGLSAPHGAFGTSPRGYFQTDEEGQKCNSFFRTEGNQLMQSGQVIDFQGKSPRVRGSRSAVISAIVSY
ncbi:MAG: hypothetical protein LBE86_09865 [Gemmobacter sp.]|jgi:hypothetical protein|nr:hypothetical protein [Gemmobacter sp.]